jgi:SAM-dependent methyltransferase
MTAGYVHSREVAQSGPPAPLEDSRLIEYHRAMLRDLGAPLSKRARILDFGCGLGHRVYQYRAAGYKAFGVDFPQDWKPVEQKCVDAGLATSGERFLRPLDTAPYRIPFDDEEFDFVFSEQVFEHVQDYDVALAEIRRVLRQGGSCLHDFPSRLRPIEAHVHVPFAGVIRSRKYLALWARLGIRNEFQAGLAADEVVRRNYEYLRGQTMYLTKKQLAAHLRRQFPIVRFVERLFIEHSWGRLHALAPIARFFPALGTVVSAFHTRVVFCRKG